MTKEEMYFKHKKKSLINHLMTYSIKRFGENVFDYTISSLDIKQTFCSFTECQNCGKCCHKFPCVFSTSDFLNIRDLDYMRKILDTGLLCISQMCYSRFFIFRPIGVGDKKIVSLKEHIHFYSGNNTCLFNHKGCLLPESYRPTEGLMYIPTTNNDHIVMCTEKDLERQYTPYQDVMHILIEEYYSQNTDQEITSSKVMKLTRYMAGYRN